MQSKLLILFVFAALVGCSGVQHVMPDIDSAAQSQALLEIKKHHSPPPLNQIEPENAESKLQGIYQKLRPAAVEVCAYAEEQEVCDWDVRYEEDDRINAYADGEKIVVFHGVISLAGSDDEIAFVLAHEIAHHIAEHIEESQQQRAAGAIIGAIAMAAIAVNSGGCYSYSCQQNVSNAVESSAHLGALVADRAFNISQEKEADYLSAYILYRAGYDLFEARNLVLKMGVLSGKERTGLLETHPAGPERLATFDKVIETIYFDDDVLPDKVGLTSATNARESSGPRRR